MERRILLPSDLGLSLLLRGIHVTGGLNMTGEDGIAKLYEVAAWWIVLLTVTLDR